MTEKQTVPQQSIQPTPEFVQQISLLNARVTNVNLANADLLREMDNTFKTMATTIAALKKENAELKAKAETPKSPKA